MATAANWRLGGAVPCWSTLSLGNHCPDGRGVGLGGDTAVCLGPEDTRGAPVHFSQAAERGGGSTARRAIESFGAANGPLCFFRWLEMCRPTRTRRAPEDRVENGHDRLCKLQQA